MRRIRSFLGLSPRERWLYAYAALLDAVFRVVPLALPFSATRALARRMSKVGPRREAAPIVAATLTAGRVVPGSNCLSEALTAWVLLSRGGHVPELRIGVANDESFEAHAWVECGGVTQVGQRPGATFRPLVGGDVMRA
jgi:hypothetical protein